jgi:hypothetical protein
MPAGARDKINSWEVGQSKLILIETSVTVT